MKEQLISRRTKIFMALALAFCANGIVQLVAEDWSRPVYDFFFNLRGPLPVTSDVAIVAIDELAFDNMTLANVQWPWPRRIHGKLIDTLFEAGAKTVALDILFAEPAADPADDDELAAAIRRHPDVVLGREFSYFVDPVMGFEQMKIVSPSSITSRLEGTEPPLGFVSIAPEADGYLRRVGLEFPDGPAFSAAAAFRYLAVTGRPEPKLERKQFSYINFSGPGRSVPTVSYVDALEPETYLPPGFFKDKLVFVGLSASSSVNIYSPTADHFLVPFSRLDGAYMPGVEVHANAALSILNDNFIRRISPDMLGYWGLVVGFVSGVIFLTFRPLESTVLYLIIALGLFTASFHFFTTSHIDIGPIYLIIPITLSYLACPFLHYWYTHKQKAFIRKAFASYISPHLVSQLIADPERLELGGEEAEGTVVFLDLAGFTSFSEKLKPRELIELINRNLGACADIILRWDGMIDKYIGDCIMAVWGVPVHAADHASRACSAVFDVHEEMKNLSAKEHALTGVNLSVRIGVNSGLLVAGNVGGEKHFNYTVLGNEVNLASRLEGINKYYGTDIVLSEATAKRLDPSFILRELDIIRVVGQQKPTRIYQLIGRQNRPPAPPMVEADALFQEGRRFYNERRWTEATTSFSAALAKLPEDGPSKKYLARCEEYASAPPPEDWDGVYQMTSK